MSWALPFPNNQNNDDNPFGIQSSLFSLHNPTIQNQNDDTKKVNPRKHYEENIVNKELYELIKSDFTCCVCYEILDDPSRCLNCGYLICNTCLVSSFNLCPLCKSCQFDAKCKDVLRKLDMLNFNCKQCQLIHDYSGVHRCKSKICKECKSVVHKDDIIHPCRQKCYNCKENYSQRDLLEEHIKKRECFNANIKCCHCMIDKDKDVEHDKFECLNTKMNNIFESLYLMIYKMMNNKNILSEEDKLNLKGKSKYDELKHLLVDSSHDSSNNSRTITEFQGKKVFEPCEMLIEEQLNSIVIKNFNSNEKINEINFKEEKISNLVNQNLYVKTKIINNFQIRINLQNKNAQLINLQDPSKIHRVFEENLQNMDKELKDLFKFHVESQKQSQINNLETVINAQNDEFTEESIELSENQDF